MRKLPQNIEAEQNVIGSMLWSRYAIEEAVAKLNASSFYAKEHETLFNAIVDLYENRKDADIPSVTAYLVDKGMLSQAGGVEYMTMLTEKVFTTTNVHYYIDIVYDRALARRLIEITEKIASQGYEDELNASDYLDQAEREILEVSRSRQASDFQESGQIIETITERLRVLANSSEGLTGTPSGYKYIDKLTNGFQPGDLIILAARPAAGKTAFALNVARNAALEGKKPVAIFSLEMPSAQLMNRIISAQGNIPGEKLRDGSFEQEDWLKYSEATSVLKGAPFHIDDSASLKVSDIASKCRKLEREKGLSLIIIDYLQLLSGSGNSRENRVVEVSEISRDLKKLARELNVPIIALSQLSRKVEERTDKRPMMSDLRESGAIEQDADIVVFLYRDDYYTQENSEVPGQVEVIFGKHRNGATGTIMLNFEKEINRFYTIEYSND